MGTHSTILLSTLFIFTEPVKPFRDKMSREQPCAQLRQMMSFSVCHYLTEIVPGILYQRKILWLQKTKNLMGIYILSLYILSIVYFRSHIFLFHLLG